MAKAKQNPKSKGKGPLTKAEKATIICFRENVGIVHLMLKEDVVKKFGVKRIRETLKAFGIKPAKGHSPSALAFTLICHLRTKTTISGHHRRYMLHQRIKNHVRYNGPKREIELPASLQNEGFKNLPDKVSKALVELRDKFKYNLQFTIQ